MKRLFAIACLLILGGCESLVRDFINQKAPAEVVQGPDRCDIPRFLIDVNLAGDALRTSAQPRGVDQYGPAVAGLLSEKGGDLLFLSGGSQNGAFGAGFLKGWHESKGGLPRFRVVTGISTGALQSTWAFIGEPQGAVDGYSIYNESSLLKTKVSGSESRQDVPTKLLIEALDKGAFSDLVPLYDWLDDLFQPRVFEAVAARYRDPNDQGRLFVGVTDVDAGRAVAFDLTQLAVKIVDAKTQERAAHFKDCYLRALIASSVVPGAARPVFIDNRMYIDGGSKFAVFAEDVGEELDAIRTTRSSLGQEGMPTLDKVCVLVNGSAGFSYDCGRFEEALCPEDGPYLGLEGRHKDWDITYVGARTVSILVDQVTRLSIDRALNLKRDRPSDAILIRLDEVAKDKHVSDLNRTDVENRFEDTKLSCADWRSRDRALDDPLEFEPRHMHCMIDFGRSYALSDKWRSQGVAGR